MIFFQFRVKNKTKSLINLHDKNHDLLLGSFRKNIFKKGYLSSAFFMCFHQYIFFQQ